MVTHVTDQALPLTLGRQTCGNWDEGQANTHRYHGFLMASLTTVLLSVAEIPRTRLYLERNISTP